MSLRRERLDSGESLRLNPSPKCHFGGSVTGCALYAEAAPAPPALARLRTPPRTQPCRVPAPAPGTAAPPAGARPPCASIPQAGCSVREGPWLAHALSLHALPAHTRACRSRRPPRCHCAAAAPSSPHPSLSSSLPPCRGSPCSAVLGAGSPAAGRALRAAPAGSDRSGGD